MGTPEGTARFWLLVAGIPAGPFTAEELLGRLGRGEVTPECLVCPIGGAAWEPVKHWAELGGIPPPPAAPGPAGAIPAVVGGGDRARLVKSLVGALVLVALAYLTYSLCRGLTPREVCERFEAAHTLEQARGLVTPRLLPAVQALMAQPDPGEELPTLLTYEHPAPAHVGGYFVGVRTVIRDERGWPADVEGVYHVVKQGSWKVDDMLIVGVDGRRFEQPVSVAMQYRELLGLAPQQAGALPRAATPVAKEAASWWDKPSNRTAAGMASFKFMQGSGGKWLAGLMVVLGGAVLGTTGRKKGCEQPGSADKAAG
jgi:hypothetical protein